MTHTKKEITKQDRLDYINQIDKLDSYWLNHINNLRAQNHSLKEQNSWLKTDINAELLEVLKMLVVKCQVDGVTEDILNEANEAIKKAEGK